MVTTLLKKDWFHADGFPIAVERRNRQEAFGLHNHEFSEIVLITGGRGQHVLEEDSWQLSMGDVFVIGGTRLHDYASVDQLSLINILFDPEALEWTLADLPGLPGYHALFHLEPTWRKRHQFRSRLRVTPSEMATAIGMIDQLDEELTRRGPGFQFMANAAFMQIIGYLSRCYERSKHADSHALLRIAQSITHLETCFAQPIGLDELVEISGMSRRSFLRDFEAATGCSPIAYLIQIRINQAAKMLRQTRTSVTEIAFQSGFSDSNYFARQFKKHMSVSPRQYRQRAVAS